METTVTPKQKTKKNPLTTPKWLLNKEKFLSPTTPKQKAISKSRTSVKKALKTVRSVYESPYKQNLDKDNHQIQLIQNTFKLFYKYITITKQTTY
jgi:hypothetical protein